MATKILISIVLAISIAGLSVIVDNIVLSFWEFNENYNTWNSFWDVWFGAAIAGYIMQ